jgi:hypothetical protein
MSIAVSAPRPWKKPPPGGADVMLCPDLSVVMAGLVPAIPLRQALCIPKRDARVKPAHDNGEDT